MKISSLFLASRLALAFTFAGIGVLASVSNNAGSVGTGLSDEVSHLDRAYIVEFDPATYNPNQKRSQQPHGKLNQHLSNVGAAGYTTRYEWSDPRIFVGTSIVLHDDNDYQKLLQAPGVKKVYRNRVYSRPTLKNVHVSDSVGSASANGVTQHSVETRPLQRRDLSDPPQQMVSTEGLTGQQQGVKDTFPPHVMTGVDKLHALGFFGDGQVIGVIDTGIDYTHPALGDCFGPDCKVIGGYDFVGAGHGTHVAGIIAANDTNLGFTGAAPHAKLRAYRVFGCTGGVANDVLIAALHRGFSDGNDILSLSIAAATGWSEVSGSPAAVVAHGTPVVVANGNDGTYGTFFASTGLAGDGVAAIGSVQSTDLVFYTMNVNPKSLGKDRIYYLGFKLSVAGGKPLELYATSLDPNITNDACNPLADSTPDLSNKVVLVRRGTCDFVVKYQNVLAKGGKYIVIYNSVSNYLLLPHGLPGQQVTTISHQDGEFLVQQLAAGKKLTLDFSNPNISFAPDSISGGLMSSFSDYTPTYENKLQTDFSAPGGNILSTWPVALGSYNVISGTSMATPFISGAYALYRSAHGGKTDPETLRNVFASTATPVRATKNSNSLLETVIKQGTGLVNVYDAFFQQVTYTPHSIQLNDTRYFNGTQRVTVKNASNRPRVYTIQHEPSATVISLKDNATFNQYPLPLLNQYANVEFSKTRLVVAPGQSASFEAKFTPPQGVAEDKLPVYGGWLRLVPESNQYSGLRISYMGIKSDTSKMSIIDGTNEFFGNQLPFLFTKNAIVTDDSHSLNLQQQRLLCYFRFIFGTPFYQIDIVPANTTFIASIPINDGSKQQQRYGKSNLKFDQVKVIGTLISSNYVTRNTIQDGGATQKPFNFIQLDKNVISLSNGTLISLEKGHYRLLLRAQHVLTNGTFMSDYDSYLSHSFQITKYVTSYVFIRSYIIMEVVFRSFVSSVEV